MEKYEIWICDFPFEEAEDSKIRPALIVEDGVIEIESMKITSQFHSSNYDYLIQNYVGTGLRTQPSYIKYQKIYKFEKSRFIKKIGKLSEDDIGAFVEKGFERSAEKVDLT